MVLSHTRCSVCGLGRPSRCGPVRPGVTVPRAARIVSLLGVCDLFAMHLQDMAIIKGLVSVAWADDRIADEEQQVIDALLAAYSATASESREIRKYAQTKRTLEDIQLTELSADDRRVLLQHAVLLTFIDGEQHQKEKELLEDLTSRLRIPPAEAERVMSAAEQRAKALLSQL